MAALKLIMYDVGQGDCILVHFPRGKLGLIDCSTPATGPECPATRYIKEHGSRLAFLCLTHPHADHYAGMLSILRDKNIKIDRFWHSMSANLELILKFINERSIPIIGNIGSNKLLGETRNQELLDIFDFLHASRRGFEQSFGEFTQLPAVDGVKIFALAPSYVAFKSYGRGLIGAVQKERRVNTTHYMANRVSLVLHLAYGDNRIVLGGDALRANWREVIRGTEERDARDRFFPVDCVKAPHHGARDSVYEGMWSFLLKRNGRVLVSAGDHAHPSAEFVKSIGGRWCVLCTNRAGYCCRGQHRIAKGSEVDLVLAEMSRPSSPQQCFGRVEIEFYKGAPPKIVTEQLPQFKARPGSTRIPKVR